MNIASALRHQARAPLFALIVFVLTAAVVAVNATAFGAIHSLRWRAMPYADAGQLVDLGANLRHFGMRIGLSASLRDAVIADRSHFDGALGFVEANENESGRAWHVTRVTPDFASFLGVTPALGRAFAVEDAQAGADAVLVLSDATWRSRYASDPAIVGRAIRFGEKTYTVIGVMPPGFAFPDTTTDAWRPFVESAYERTQASRGTIGVVRVIARRATDVSIDQARAALGTILEHGVSAGFRDNADVVADVTPWRERFAGQHEQALVLFQIAALILLAVVLSNLVNIELDRLIARRRELDVRRALGATDNTLRRGLVAELLPPVAAGLALGLAVTPFALRIAVATDLLPAVAPQGTGFGWPSLAAGVAVAVVALAVPAVALSTMRSRSLNRAGLGGLGRLRSALLVAQIALTTALLGTTALLLQSALGVVSADPGFDPRGVVLTDVDLPGITLGDRVDPPDVERYRPLVEVLRGDVAALPGVDYAAVAATPPFSKSETVSTLRAAGRTDELQARMREIGAGYFAAFGIRLVAGRDFTAADAGDAGPVIVDEIYRDRYLGGLDPLTQYVELPNDDGKTFHRAPIVGVARTVKHQVLDERPNLATVYTFDAAPMPTFWLVTRTHGDARALADTVRRRILERAPDATIVVSAALSDRIAATLENREALLGALGAFAAATLALSMLGLAAVLSSAIRRRTAEIGVRIALGATPSRVRNLVLRQGTLLVGAGILLGLGAGLALARMLADRLFGIGFTDATSWLATLALIALVALSACWWPARRASAIDPVDALRSE